MLSNIRYAGMGILLILHSVLYGQEGNATTQLRMEIDSIAKSYSIEKGTVYYRQVSSMFDNTSTSRSELSKMGKFVLHGQFLIFGNEYYNLSKLLYFVVKEDSIEFYFQGY